MTAVSAASSLAVVLLLAPHLAAADSSPPPAPAPTLPAVLVKAIDSYRQPSLRDVTGGLRWQDKGKSMDTSGFDNHSEGRFVWNAPSAYVTLPMAEMSGAPQRAVAPATEAFTEVRAIAWTSERKVRGGVELGAAPEGSKMTLFIDGAGRIKSLALRGESGARVDVAYTTDERGGQRLLTKLRFTGDLAPRLREGGGPDLLEETWTYDKVNGAFVVKRYQKKEVFQILEHVVTLDFSDLRVNSGALVPPKVPPSLAKVIRGYVETPQPARLRRTERVGDKQRVLEGELRWRRPPRQEMGWDHIKPRQPTIEPEPEAQDKPTSRGPVLVDAKGATHELDLSVVLLELSPATLFEALLADYVGNWTETTFPDEGRTRYSFVWGGLTSSDIHVDKRGCVVEFRKGTDSYPFEHHAECEVVDGRPRMTRLQLKAGEVRWTYAPSGAVSRCEVSQKSRVDGSFTTVTEVLTK